MEVFEIGKGILLDIACGIKDFIVGLYNFFFKFLFAQNYNETARHKSKHTQGSSVKSTVLQCVKFGLLFWLLCYIFHELIIKIISLLTKWFGLENCWLLNLTLHLVFYSFWILPMFFLSKLLSFLWYQDIADITFISANIKKNVEHKISVSLADQFKSFLLQTVYCAQGFVAFLLPLPPVLQYLWYLYHLALLTSLYAFEYKWVHRGMLLHRRLLNIDRKWPYYFGFGLPLALFTMVFASFIDNMIVFTTIFPVCIIISASIIDDQSPAAAFPLSNFKFADFASDTIINFFWNVLPAGFTFFIR